MGRLFNRGEFPAEPEPEPYNLFAELPVGEEVLAAAGIEFHFIVGGNEPMVPCYDRDKLAELVDEAREYLIQTGQLKKLSK
jgi:hypothetical protein